MRQKRGRWCSSEDAHLRRCVLGQLVKAEVIKEFKSTGIVPKGFSWKAVETKMKSRNSKQCRERWINHLSPTVVKDEWTPEEDEELHQLFLQKPNKWVEIAKKMPGRSQNQVKMRWRALRRRSSKLNPRKLRKLETVKHQKVELDPEMKQSDFVKMEDLVRQEELGLFLNHSPLPIVNLEEDFLRTFN